MMRTTLHRLGLMAWMAGIAAGPLRAEDLAGAREFVGQYCVKCHGAEKAKGDISFEAFRSGGSILDDRAAWEKAVKVVASGEMPPDREGVPRPVAAEAERFSSEVAEFLEEHDRKAPPDPGRVTMRRLNRFEYRNTVRDLTGVDFDAASVLPSDDIGYGFDSIGDVLSLSPLLMERYLAAAETIMEQAIIPDPPAPVQRQLASRFTEPSSAEVATKVMEGEWRRVSTDGATAIELGGIHSPYQWEAGGDYVFRTKVYGKSGDGGPLRVGVLLTGAGLEKVSPDEELAKFSGNVLRPARLLATFPVKADAAERAEVIEVKLPAEAGRERVMLAMEKPAAGVSRLWIEYFALEGPLDSRPASQRLLLETGESDAAAKLRDVLGRFMRRAFRRPLEPGELEALLRLAGREMEAGARWEAAARLAMQAVLCSPKFLFRVELDDRAAEPGEQELNEHQVASRLSYFLWSTMPDAELMALADRGELKGQLEPQVRRMLRDPRALTLVTNFAMQWLQLRRIDFVGPDGKLFPAFNDQLRASMLRETERFVASVFFGGRNLLELIDAEFTWVNEPLARHYGLPYDAAKAAPDGFQMVALQDRTRGGLLTQASVLTVTSNPTRTSPVKRGKWVLEQLLGTPPPPPPPNVPELEKAGGGLGDEVSLRERMEEHRKNAACAGCHARMDGLGFALENFDAVGAFREKDGRHPVDARGTLGRTEFTGPGGVKDLLLERRGEFLRCLAEKLMTYALGRGMQSADRPVLASVVRETEAGANRFSALVTAIVRSEAFLKRRGHRPE